MVEITINVDDAIYERFTKMCDVLGKDAITFIQERVNAELVNHLKMLSEALAVHWPCMKEMWTVRAMMTPDRFLCRERATKYH